MARTGGTPNEHGLRGEKALCFQHAVCSCLCQELGGAFVVGRRRRLKTEGGCQIGLEHPVGCCLGRIGPGGEYSRLRIATGLRRTVRCAFEAEPPRRIFRIVKVKEDVFVLGAIGFSGHGHDDGLMFVRQGFDMKPPLVCRARIWFREKRAGKRRRRRSS